MEHDERKFFTMTKAVLGTINGLVLLSAILILSFEAGRSNTNGKGGIVEADPDQKPLSDEGFVSQVRNDWMENFWVSLAVTTEDKCPELFPDDFVYHVWPGTTIGCDCISEDLTFTRDQFCYSNYNATTKEGCKNVQALPPVVENRLNGVRVCGRRGKYSFATAIRNVDNTTIGKCPEGYRHCGTTLIPEAKNTICITEEEFVTGDKCPIVEILFILPNQIPLYKKAGWTVIQAESVVLAYSKEPNALPVTTTKLSTEQPCLNPYENPKPIGENVRYIGELDYNLQNCSTYSQAANGEKYYEDLRFKRSGLRVQMLTLQEQSTVLNKLEDRPHYTFTVFPGSKVKQFFWYNVYYRQVIDFSLTCEYDSSNVFTQQNYLQALKNNSPKNLISSQYTYGINLLISFTTISLLLVFVDKKTLDYLLVILSVHLFSFFYILTGPCIAFGRAFATNVSYASSLREIAKFNHCVDTFTQINAEEIITVQHAWYDSMVSLIFWIVLISTVALCAVSGLYVTWIVRMAIRQKPLISSNFKCMIEECKSFVKYYHVFN